MRERHPLAGKTVVLRSRCEEVDGRPFHVKDWWQNVNGTGESWRCCTDSICFSYGFRSGWVGLPLGDEVVHGEVDGEELLVHESELGEEIKKSE